MSKNNKEEFSGTGLAVGVAMGVSIGLAMDNLATGIAIGISLGVSLSLIWKKKENSLPLREVAPLCQIASLPYVRYNHY
ncbi:hypothetical protein QNH46_15900 [Paenibacillus woosongensis]|uniref:Glycine zipper-like domain-containing protein n=1 Tax=Paenibacillus woosongensis TaxID=307580 RepID=A0AA95I9B3_9BACL|nr:hypothetical protein [Paenibacillus woosongensis]WHX47628.1 hypothetical protein QNH46_15900 [Paenibacillus woosongensis]